MIAGLFLLAAVTAWASGMARTAGQSTQTGRPALTVAGHGLWILAVGAAMVAARLAGYW